MRVVLSLECSPCVMFLGELRAAVVASGGGGGGETTEGKEEIASKLSMRNGTGKRSV